jgi:hypothetical protein
MIYAIQRLDGQMIRSLRSHWPEYLMEGTELIVYCAKLHHHNHARCIFNCRFDELMQKDDRASTP